MYNFVSTEVKDLRGQGHVLGPCAFRASPERKKGHTFLATHSFNPTCWVWGLSSLGGQFNHFWLKIGALHVLKYDSSPQTSRASTVYSLEHSQTAGMRSSDFCNVCLCTDSAANVKLTITHEKLTGFDLMF